MLYCDQLEELNNERWEEPQKQEVNWREPTNHVRVYPRLGEELRHLFLVDAFSLPLATIRVDVDQQASGSVGWRRKTTTTTTQKNSVTRGVSARSGQACDGGEFVPMAASCSRMLATQWRRRASSRQANVTSAHRHRCRRHLSTYDTGAGREDAQVDQSGKKNMANT